MRAGSAGRVRRDQSRRTYGSVSANLAAMKKGRPRGLLSCCRTLGDQPPSLEGFPGFAGVAGTAGVVGFPSLPGTAGVAGVAGVVPLGVVAGGPCRAARLFDCAVVAC